MFVFFIYKKNKENITGKWFPTHKIINTSKSHQYSIKLNIGIVLSVKFVYPVSNFSEISNT